ncbi:MAG TPA: DUF4388 domain-containing protein, partial [Clostridia bacterium]|nr:DUF4388 domain-containing protein [Clostridia bacterium]
PMGLLSGTASPVMLAEVIQILSRTQRSGEFVIDALADTFRLFFDQGNIINASSQRHPPGLESFQQALRVPVGSYQFLEKPIGSMERLINEDTEFLLLNAMQEVDEASTTNCET